MYIALHILPLRNMKIAEELSLIHIFSVLSRYFENPMVKLDKDGCMGMEGGKVFTVPVIDEYCLLYTSRHSRGVNYRVPSYEHLALHTERCGYFSVDAQEKRACLHYCGVTRYFSE